MSDRGIHVEDPTIVDGLATPQSAEPPLDQAERVALSIAEAELEMQDLTARAVEITKTQQALNQELSEKDHRFTFLEGRIEALRELG